MTLTELHLTHDPDTGAVRITGVADGYTFEATGKVARPDSLTINFDQPGADEDTWGADRFRAGPLVPLRLNPYFEVDVHADLVHSDTATPFVTLAKEA